MRSSIKKGAIKSILVTAGPTRERIDPVRFISNYSTGIFGYEIAREAEKRGYKVTLVSGPSNLKPPQGVRLIKVESAGQMRREVLKNAADCVIATAAVCDWKPARASKTKLKKDGRRKILELEETADILSELGKAKRGVLAGFALETENLEANAARKMRQKNLDFIVANKLKANDALFGDNIIDIIIIDRYGGRQVHKNKSKRELAKIILDKVSNFNI